MCVAALLLGVYVVRLLNAIQIDISMAKVEEKAVEEKPVEEAKVEEKAVEEKPVEEPNVNDVRQKTRNSLDKGISDGSLVKVLGGTEESAEVKPAQVSLDDVRQRARNSFDKGIS